MAVQDPAVQALLGGRDTGVTMAVPGEGQPQSGGEQAVWPLVGGTVVVIVGSYSQSGCLLSLSPSQLGVQCLVTFVHAGSLLVLVGLIVLHYQAVLGIMEGSVGLSLLFSALGVSWFWLRAWGSPQCCSSEGR